MSTTGLQDIMRVPLVGVDGQEHSLGSLAGTTATAVIFMANGCPTVRAYEGRLIALADAWRPAGLEVVGVNSNNASLSPPDTVDEMVARATKRSYTFAYLKDADGALARAFGAVCTPHAFLLDPVLDVLYSGRIDDSRLGKTITSADLEDAVADVMAGRPVKVRSTEPFGCSIVW
ncbi:MAG: thioredoxin family protein [Nitriliruptorales bacterium]